MDWQQIAVAGIGGGVSAAVGSLIGAALARLLPERWGRITTTIVTVAAMLIGSRGAVSYYDGQRTAPANIESQLLADPRFGSLASAWRDSDPRSFGAAVAGVSESVRAGRERNLAVNDLRFLLTSAAVPRMKHLDDRQMLETVRVARDEFQELASSHPETCEPMFNGRAFGDISAHLSEDLGARERELLEAAFRVDTTIQRNVLDGPDLDAAIQNVLFATRERVGEDVSLLAADAEITGREARYCEVVVAFHEEILELPESEAAALARGLR